MVPADYIIGLEKNIPAEVSLSLSVTTVVRMSYYTYITLHCGTRHVMHTPITVLSFIS
jgi:hypothetical protein